MSAFYVGRRHIASMVRFGRIENSFGLTAGGRLDATASINLSNPENSERAAAILVDGNRLGLIARYGKSGVEKAEPLIRYEEIMSTALISVLAMLKACDCYDYQACERKNYEVSRAAFLVHILRNHAIGLLPGYKEQMSWPIS